MIKYFGAILIILSCGALGFLAVNAHKKEERELQQLYKGLEYMLCELQYRLTPLPELCRSTAEVCSGKVSAILEALGQELMAQIAPDASACMYAAVSKYPNLPSKLQKCFLELGSSLGRFDLPGQVNGLEAVKKCVALELSNLQQNQEVRLRSYQTMGLCAGSALALLLL